MMKIKAGDTIKVILGKDKDREGKVEKILPKTRSVIVPGLNVYKRHVKGSQGRKSGIYDIPRPLSFAKISLVCPKCKKPTRVGFQVLSKKEKARICRKCGREIDNQ